jgi:hypothetical protein
MPRFSGQRGCAAETGVAPVVPLRAADSRRSALWNATFSPAVLGEPDVPALAERMANVAVAFCGVGRVTGDFMGGRATATVEAALVAALLAPDSGAPEGGTRELGPARPGSLKVIQA